MALKLTAGQREVLEGFVQTSNWNGHARMPEPAFLYNLGDLGKLTDQALADFYTEVVVARCGSDIKLGWVPRLYRDGCYVHLAWQSPPSEKRWQHMWWYSLTDFAAHVNGGGANTGGGGKKK